MSDQERELLLNREAIAINQDPSEQGRRLKACGGEEIWAKKLAGGGSAWKRLPTDAACCC